MKNKNSKEKKSTDKKVSSYTKKELKENYIVIGIFLLISFILGLIFMDFMFAGILVGGLILIMLLSMLVSKLRRKRWLRITINILTIFFLIACIAAMGGVGWFLNYVVSNAPDFDPNQLVMTQTSIIYDNKENSVIELGTEKREIISYEEMSQSLIDALIATEDARFFQHNGFDAARFTLASLKQATGDTDAGGASTITMQVAKNAYTSRTDKGFEGIVRKFTDIYLSVFRIEKQYSKQEIIEFYVNNHFLGVAYGVEQASREYFGKNAADLTLSEAALLIGLFKSPAYYNPFKNPDAATSRRLTVLNLMLHHGYITEEERDLAAAIPVESLLKQSSTAAQPYLSYINEVIEEAIKVYGINPSTTSVLVYTNLDTSKQQVVDDIMNGKTYTWLNPEVQAGVAVVDVWSGKLLAVGAGRNIDSLRQMSYASMTNRQIGSVAKPLFDYGPGIEYNNWSTYKLFDDKQYYYSSGQEIRNSDRTYRGIMTLRWALADSRNIPALQAFQQVDNKKILQFVKSLGIKPEESNGYLHEAHSIGAFNGSNPLEMAAAYAAFANGGTYYEPYAITKIILRDTGEVYTHEEKSTKVMSDSTAFMITDCLKTSVDQGIAYVAKVNGVNVAAKTGTTNFTEAIQRAKGLPSSAINDAWVVGYDPDTAIGLWYGYEPISTKYYTTVITASQQRQKLFNALGSRIFAKSGKSFKIPNSVVKVGVEMGSDINDNPKLAGANTPTDKIIYEYFKKGTEPTETSTAYDKLANVTGLKVTYNPSTLTTSIAWNTLNAPDSNVKDAGSFGYRVYKDSTYLGFTTQNKFTIANDSDPAATYKIITSYENNNSNNSSGTTYTLSNASLHTYTLKLNTTVKTTTEYVVGTNLSASDFEPSKADLILTEDDVVITSKLKASQITVTKYDSANNVVGNISTLNEETYTITYDINYYGYTKSISRTVKIKPETIPTP